MSNAQPPSGPTVAASEEFRYGGSELDTLSQMPRYYDWILSHFRARIRGRTVEYGAGIGTVSAILRPLTETLILVEPDGRLSSHLKQRFAADPAVTVAPMSLEEHVGQLVPASVDSIVMVNVLEHIEDHRSSVQALAQALAPGGHLALFVPAMPLLMSDLDRKFGHFRRYTRDELSQILTAAGLQVIEIRYFDILGVLPWLLLNRILGMTEISPAAASVYDRWLVPPGRVAESLVRPPFGKNLIAVAKRLA